MSSDSEISEMGPASYWESLPRSVVLDYGRVATSAFEVYSTVHEFEDLPTDLTTGMVDEVVSRLTDDRLTQYNRGENRPILAHLRSRDVVQAKIAFSLGKASLERSKKDVVTVESVKEYLVTNGYAKAATRLIAHESKVEKRVAKSTAKEFKLKKRTASPRSA